MPLRIRDSPVPETGSTSLGEKLAPIAADSRLKDLEHILTLVDGSIVEALPRIAMASFRDAHAGGRKKLLSMRSRDRRKVVRELDRLYVKSRMSPFLETQARCSRV